MRKNSRLLDGNSRGDNPLPDDQAQLRFVDGEGVETSVDVTGSHAGGRTTFTAVIPAGAVSVRVTDVYGNEGTATIL